MNLPYKNLFLVALPCLLTTVLHASQPAKTSSMLLVPQTSVAAADSAVSKAETATSKAEIKADAQITQKRPLVTSEVDEDEVEEVVKPKRKTKKAAPKKKRLVTIEDEDSVEDEAEEVETKKVEKKTTKPKKKPLVVADADEDEEAVEKVVTKKKTTKSKKRPLVSTKSDDDEEEVEQPKKTVKKEETADDEKEEKKSESGDQKLKITQDWDKKTLGYKHWTGWYYPSKWILSFNGKEVLSFEGKEFDIRAKTITVDPSKTLKARIVWEFLGGRRKGWKEVDYKINENTDTLKLSFDWKNEPYQLTIANTKPIATRSSDNKTD